MKIDAPLLVPNPLQAKELARTLESGGYDGAYTFDGPNDPFFPLAIAAEHTERLQLYTAIAVAFAVASPGMASRSSSGWRLRYARSVRA